MLLARLANFRCPLFVVCATRYRTVSLSLSPMLSPLVVLSTAACRRLIGGDSSSPCNFCHLAGATEPALLVAEEMLENAHNPLPHVALLDEHGRSEVCHVSCRQARRGEYACAAFTLCLAVCE